jgi:hypothetical protein
MDGGGVGKRWMREAAAFIEGRCAGEGNVKGGEGGKGRRRV